MEVLERRWSSSVILPLFILSLRIPGALTLTLTLINVPAHRVVGEEARLLCKFDMEGDTLYSVKWYKDDQEFYRFVPNDKPKLQVFQQTGIKVDRQQSSRHLVVLKQVDLHSGGTYKCEVSAEAPSFKTKSAHQDMVVVITPKQSEIVGAQPKYKVGDRVNVTCFSYRSKPAASLTWRVNDIEVSPLYETFGDLNGFGSMQHSNGRNMLLNAELREYKPQVEPDELETSALGLSFQVQNQHLGVGLKLECTASIGSVFWQSFQEKIPVAPRDQPAITSNWWTTDSGGAAATRTRTNGLFLLLPAAVVTISVMLTKTGGIFFCFS